jgi:hypothetical protein
LSCGAGISPALLDTEEIGKIAGETPAPRNTSAMRNPGQAHNLRILNTYLAETHPRGIVPNGFRARYTSP